MRVEPGLRQGRMSGVHAYVMKHHAMASEVAGVHITEPIASVSQVHTNRDTMPKDLKFTVTASQLHAKCDATGSGRLSKTTQRGHTMSHRHGLLPCHACEVLQKAMGLRLSPGDSKRQNHFAWQRYLPVVMLTTSAKCCVDAMG